MPNDQTTELTEELKRFQAEKEKIRRIVGQIGKKSSPKREKVVTIVLAVLLILLFAADMSRYLLGISVPLPPLFSFELGILLVSLKIIWMIHKQTRVEHFQFWILNSIEFRIDQVSSQLRDIETRCRDVQNGEQGTSERLRVSRDADATERVPPQDKTYALLDGGPWSLMAAVGVDTADVIRQLADSISLLDVTQRAGPNATLQSRGGRGMRNAG